MNETPHPHLSPADAKPQMIEIAGQKVRLAWTAEAKRNMRVRASKISVHPGELVKSFGDPGKAEYAFTAFIWLLLPAEIYRRYSIPEDMFADIPEDERKAAERFDAVMSIIDDINASAEKKSDSES